MKFEKPYQIGDKVKIGEYYGEVSDIGIRSTRLITPDDNLVSVPNYLIFTQAVASANAGSPEMMVVIDLFMCTIYGMNSSSSPKLPEEPGRNFLKKELQRRK